MTVRLRLGAVVVAAVLALAGCTGDGDDIPDPAPTAAASASTDPMAGTLVSRETFALTLPDGWAEAEPGDATLLALSDQTIDQFTTNLNVVEDTTLADLGPAELGEALQEIATTAEATDVEALGELEVDGEIGARVTSVQSIGSVEARSELIAVSHDGIGYVVTISFSPATSQPTRDTTVESVMDTWTWAA